MKPRPRWVLAAQFIGIGWYIAIAILAPTLGGVWLDGKLGTAPLFLLVGVILGVVVGFYGTYKMASSYLSSPPRSDDRHTRG